VLNEVKRIVRVKIISSINAPRVAWHILPHLSFM
jgi:hypothetical protein